MDHKKLNNKVEDLIIKIATLNDVNGIHFVLNQNLVKIKNINELPDEKRKDLEDRGFLRKQVDVEFYKDLIERDKTEIYIAQDNNNIIGFASIYKNQNNIRKIRDTSIILHINEKKDEALLIDKELNFVYLDQLSVIPDYQHKGVATAILNKILEHISDPIISFIVKVPLANNASEKWHIFNNFKSIGTAEGIYKEKSFLWNVYRR